MACPFHYHLRRDAAGDGKADEGASAGVSSQHGVLGVSLFDTFAAAEANSFDGLPESAELSQILQVFVHLLVADDQQREIVFKGLIGILVQDLFGEGVEVDGDAVVRFLSSDVKDAILDVVPSETGHIRIPERSEGTEAEQVSGLGQAAGIVYLFLVFISIIIQQLDFGSVGRDFITV